MGPLPATILSSFGLHLVLGSEMSGGPPIGHYFNFFSLQNSASGKTHHFINPFRSSWLKGPLDVLHLISGTRLVIHNGQ